LAGALKTISYKWLYFKDYQGTGYSRPSLPGPKVQRIWQSEILLATAAMADCDVAGRSRLLSNWELFRPQRFLYA
jgi:hypothetical protein